MTDPANLVSISASALLRLSCIVAVGLALASCDKCGNSIFGSPKSQVCKGDIAPR